MNEPTTEVVLGKVIDRLENAERRIDELEQAVHELMELHGRDEDES